MKSLYGIEIGRKTINEIKKVRKIKPENKKRISLKIAEDSGSD